MLFTGGMLPQPLAIVGQVYWATKRSTSVETRA